VEVAVAERLELAHDERSLEQVVDRLVAVVELRDVLG
jgi:hypothetical protein